ncbi:hypothetical protein BGP_0918 [Beggiatoa sp. PS]|nr:hypothetical protein BGP_0918 [Beggiatoa sp. PS]
MRQDEVFARNLERAVETENDYWLMELIGNVIGVVVEFASDIWDWLRDIFR